MTLRFIDKYEIVTTLGRGSMGVVYKAKDPEIGRLVAIKTLKSVFMGDDAAGNEALQRFRQESRSAGKLHHPNIVTIFEAGRTDNGSPYIVMEYIEGKSMEAMLAEGGPLEPLAVLHYLAQIGSAIDYAHSQSVIHRDIKPSNIIVDAHHRPYLLDFGVAKLSDTSLTPAGTVVGTPSYMSPEQIRGSQLDGRTDLFSLGVVTFEAFTGSRPFPGTDFTSVVGNIIHKDPLGFADVGSQLPPELEQVLKKGLAKEREQRFASALEFIDACAQTFGVIVDGTGLAGGYSPGLKLPDVAAREMASRNRAATVIGSFQPSEVGVAAGSAGSESPVSEARTEYGDALSHARQQAEAAGDVPTTMQQRPTYTNGASAAAPEAPPAPKPREEPVKQRSASSESSISKTSRSSWTRPTIGFLALILAGLSALVVKPEWLDSIRDRISMSGTDGDADDDDFAADKEPAKKETPPAKIETKTEVKSEPKLEAKSDVKPAQQSSAATVIPTSAPVEPAKGAKPVLPAGGFTESSVAALKDAEVAWLLSRDNTDADSLRLAVAESVKRSSDDVTNALAGAAKNPDFKVRVEVLKALSKSPQHYKKKAGVDAIEASLGDSEFIVRGFAVKILAAVKGPDALPALEAMAKDEKNAVVLKVLNDTLTQLKGTAAH